MKQTEPGILYGERKGILFKSEFVELSRFRWTFRGMWSTKPSERAACACHHAQHPRLWAGWVSSVRHPLRWTRDITPYTAHALFINRDRAPPEPISLAIWETIARLSKDTNEWFMCCGRITEDLLVDTGSRGFWDQAGRQHDNVICLCLDRNNHGAY